MIHSSVGRILLAPGCTAPVVSHCYTPCSGMELLIGEFMVSIWRSRHRDVHAVVCILHHMGIPQDQTYLDHRGRPIFVVQENGEPIRELI